MAHCVILVLHGADTSIQDEIKTLDELGYSPIQVNRCSEASDSYAKAVSDPFFGFLDLTGQFVSEDSLIWLYPDLDRARIRQLLIQLLHNSLMACGQEKTCIYQAICHV